MAAFVNAVHISRQALGASAAQLPVIMPNQPLSALFVTIEAGLVAANTNDNLQTFLSGITNLIFTWKGTSIWNCRGDDLVRMCRALGVMRCRFEKTASTINARRILTITIPFGRKLFNPLECFPLVDKGTTQLQINSAGDNATYSGYKATVESLQLLGAQPTNFLRAITFSDTPSATGNKDYDLPRLYPLLGIGITTTNSEPSSTLDDIENYKILQNFQDYDYSLIQGNTAKALQWLYDSPGFDDTEIIMQNNVGAAYVQFAASGTSLLSGDLTRNFHFLHFDPTRDGTYMLDASKATDLKLRLNYNTAAAMRFMPVEYWPVDAIKNSA